MTANGRLVLLVLCFFLLGAGLTYLRLPPLPTRVNKTVINPEKAPADSPASDSQDTTVRVEIQGRGVNKPGSYLMPADSSVRDLLDRAGGLRPEAVADGLPQEQKLEEGLALTIPAESDFQRVRSGTAALTDELLIGFHGLKSSGQDGKEEERLNLNTASRAQLDSLPGIGEVLADRIVKNRNEQGSFQKPSDVKRVLGIGSGRFKRIKPFVTAR